MNLEIIYTVLLIIYMVSSMIIFCITKKKFTKPILILIISIETILLTLVLGYYIGVTSSWIRIVPIAIFIPSIGIKLASSIKNKIKFGNYQIISFSYFWNLLIENTKVRDKKKLGTVIPYSKATLKFGGRNIVFPEINSRGGTMVTGASGSGKSFQVMQLIKQDMADSRSIAFFDYKGVRETSDEIKEEAKKHGYTIYSLDEEDMYSFDPLVDISPTGRVEAILNMRKWSMDGADAHFRTNTQLLIQKYITEYDKFYFSEKRDIPYTYNLYKYIQQRKPDLSNRAIADAYKTLTTLLEIVLTSRVGDSLKGKYSRKFSFKAAAEYNEKFILIISISSDSKEFANSISSLYFRNLMAQGTMMEYSPAISLYIDEFGSLENPFVIKDILEKGRSCGIMTTIIIQDVYQIVINTNEAYLNSLLGTINNFLIFSGATKDAAIKMAGVQIREIEGIIQTLMKPIDSSPTACLITKIPILDRGKSTEVYKYVPYVKGSKVKIGGIFSRPDEDELTNSDTDSVGLDYSYNDLDFDNDVSREKDIKKKESKEADDEFDEYLNDMGL